MVFYNCAFTAEVVKINQKGGKRKMKRILVLSFMMIFLSAGFLFAEKEEEAKEVEGEIVIGLIVEAFGNEWFQELITKAKEVAGQKGVELLVDSSEWDAAKETQIFDDYIQRKVDGIAVALAQEAATRANLEKAAKAGIPVITLILEIRGGPQSTVIKHDNYGGSYNAGVWAAQFFKKQRRGVPKMAVLDFPIYQSTIDRASGFIDGFRTVYPNAEVVSQQNAEGVMDKGMTIMENIIQANPDVNVVFGINDPCALGAASAIEAAGMRDVVVVGFDGSGDSKKAIKEGGVFKASVLVDPVDYGERIVSSLVNLAQGNYEAVTFWQYVDDIVLTPDNIDQYN
jgi:ribose transport system substrate-binding protein